MAHESLVLVVDDYADAREMYAAWLEVSGYRVSQADPRTRHIPILARTGHVEATVANDAMAAGCDGFIVKPIPAPDVVHALGRLIMRAAGERPPSVA